MIKFIGIQIKDNPTLQVVKVLKHLNIGEKFHILAAPCTECIRISTP